MRAKKVLSSILLLIAMVFYFISTPAAAHCLTACAIKSPEACKIKSKTECDHKDCPMHKKAQSAHIHHHSSVNDQPFKHKIYIKCGCPGKSPMQASFHETIFLLPDANPSIVLHGGTFVPDCVFISQKAPSFAVEIPPKI